MTVLESGFLYHVERAIEGAAQPDKAAREAPTTGLQTSITEWFLKKIVGFHWTSPAKEACMGMAEPRTFDPTAARGPTGKSGGA